MADVSAALLDLGERLTGIATAGGSLAPLSQRGDDGGRQACVTELLEHHSKGLELLVGHYCESGRPNEFLHAVCHKNPDIRARTTEAVIRLLNTGRLDEKSDAVAFLSAGMDMLPKGALCNLVERVLDSPGGVCSDSDEIFTSALAFLPNLLHLKSLCGQEDGDGDDQMDGEEYKEEQISRMCAANWPGASVVSILKVMQDMSVSQPTLRIIMKKAVAEFEAAASTEMPILLYHMLVLSKKGHRDIVLDGLVKHFDDLEAKMIECEREQCEIRPELLDVKTLRSLQGTMMQHFSFTIKQDHDLAQSFTNKFTKGKEPFSHFSVALLLSIADITAWAAKIQQLLKAAVLEFYTERRTMGGSQWLRSLKLEPINRLPELILVSVCAYTLPLPAATLLLF
jgi:hypothetical protein